MLSSSSLTCLCLFTIAATGCSDEPDPDPSGGEPDPIAGLVDDCGRLTQRGLFFLGAPANGSRGTKISHHDPSTGAFQPLALSVLDDRIRLTHDSTTLAGASPDPRCELVDDAWFRDFVLDGERTPLDPERYPDGRGDIDVILDMRFAAAFPATPAEAVPAFDPRTRTTIVGAEQLVFPSQLTLTLRYLSPVSETISDIIEDQEIPLEFACTTPFPLSVYWQKSDLGGPFCAANDIGDNFCLFYEIGHGGGDCRFAAPEVTITAIEGGQAEVGIAGSIDRILEAGRIAGLNLTLDTIELR